MAQEEGLLPHNPAKQEVSDAWGSSGSGRQPPAYNSHKVMWIKNHQTLWVEEYLARKTAS
ncbi:hypothetical protein H257_06885 [Aphanomyces astaci]|uniref:Uncharacterized protein n=1 Tax=Aphanomyces astaci TaxID=112090 RepID=W4GIV9_APHAT|nr:hypothetical protein H257_06885 [Aphanomyces astaci]ETV79625.1 hypothetical protein H257_06885 [Aphanomyces astaci]|eukprot:XP_009830561.1 hypothetical protein H257_06885 [Aphanomyces astaci]